MTVHCPADRQIDQPGPGALQEKRAAGDNLLDGFQERLSFETLLGRLATRFINVSDGVGHGIEEGLKLVAEFLDVDRCSLLEPTDDGAGFAVTFSCPDLPTAPENGIAGSATAPWSMKKLAVISSRLPADLSEEAKTDNRVGLDWGGNRTWVCR